MKEQRVVISLRFPQELIDQIDRDASRIVPPISRTQLIETAVRRFLGEDVEQPKEEPAPAIAGTKEEKIEALRALMNTAGARSAPTTAPAPAAEERRRYTEYTEAELVALYAGHLALVECQDRATGTVVNVVCAVNFDGQEYAMVPLAKMFDGNPFDELNPPDPTGGFVQP